MRSSDADGGHASFAGRLIEDLAGLVRGTAALLDSASVNTFRNDPSAFVQLLVFNPHSWNPLPEQVKPAQLALLRDFRHWEEHFALLRPTLAEADRDAAEEDLAFLMSCIEQDSARSKYVPESVAVARSSLDKAHSGLVKVITALGASSAAGLVLLPDTNALTACSDPDAYRAIAGCERFTIALCSTVLAELDSLKVKTRNEEFRKRVRTAIRRIKGWRAQGPLHRGVTVSRSITVRALTVEPRFGTLPSYLDPTVQDDRLLATAMEAQRAMPGARVVIVTGDTNLQNKADFAFVPVAEGPLRTPAALPAQAASPPVNK